MNAMHKFLSEEAVSLHREYLNTLKLKYSVFEKSYKDIAGKSVNKIKTARVDRETKKEIIKTKLDIELHNLFFSSFSENPRSNSRLRDAYGSEQAFLYEVYRLALKSDGGFLVILKNRNKIDIICGRLEQLEKLDLTPCLALDLEEHAYFLDYGFSREEYIKNALSSLDISKL